MKSSKKTTDTSTFFSEKIIAWYHRNKRELPWRNTRDAYKIWLSEIILQQTRVDQGMPYYLKFIKNYPDVKQLANASEAEVLKLWQGLGYYSRARNLHAAAKYVTAELQGRFPSTFEELLKLKGVGEYTAAAIASFAYDEPKAVVDGNVFRVLARVFGIKTPIDSTTGKKEFLKLANELLDIKNPSTYNQAIMEFGAIQCKPQNPDCNSCPLAMLCYAVEKKQVNDLPVKEKKTKTRDRFFNYIVLRYRDKIVLNKRAGKDIWENMYDFPLIEMKKKFNEEQLIKSKEWKSLFKNNNYHIQSVSPVIKHVLSHQKIYARFFEVKLTQDVEEGIALDKTMIIIANKTIRNYAVPKLVENYLMKKR